jgi:hypothetical protein
MASPDERVKIVVVSLGHLVDTFFDGIDQYLIAQFSDAEKKPVAEGRLRNLFVERPNEMDSEDPSVSALAPMGHGSHEPTTDGNTDTLPPDVWEGRCVPCQAVTLSS